MKHTLTKQCLTLGFTAALAVGSNAETVTANSLQNKPQFVTQDNGYTKITIDTNHSQKKPLDTVLTLRFPDDIKNVGQSLNYILKNSGYHLTELEYTDPRTLKMYTLEIPLSQRSFYQATVLQIIQTLAGQAYETNINHVKREVSIRPISESTYKGTSQ